MATGNNQGDRQAAVRAITGTALDYNGDWMALFDLRGIPAGDFNGRMLAFINGALGTSYAEINGAMFAFGIAKGALDWAGLGTFTLPNRLLLSDGMSLFLLADGASKLLTAV